MTSVSQHPPLPPRRPAFLELLRQGAPPPPREPYSAMLRRVAAEGEAKRADPAWRAVLRAKPDAKLDLPLRDAMAELLTHALASGRDRISSREIFWRLRVKPHNEQCEGRAIARAIRSLGWVRVRYGPQDKRIWGWRWREWSVSHVKVDLKS